MYTPSITGYPLVTYSNATESEPVLGWRTQYASYRIVQAIVNVYEAPASYAMPQTVLGIKPAKIGGEGDYSIKLSDFTLVCVGPAGDKRYFWLSSNRGGAEIYVWAEERFVAEWVKSAKSFSFIVFKSSSVESSVSIPDFVSTVSKYAQSNGDVAVWSGAAAGLPFCNGFVQTVLDAMKWGTEKIRRVLACQYPSSSAGQFRFMENLRGINPKFVRWVEGPPGSQKVGNARFSDPTNRRSKSSWLTSLATNPIGTLENYATTVASSDYTKQVVPILVGGYLSNVASGGGNADALLNARVQSKSQPLIYAAELAEQPLLMTDSYLSWAL